MTLLKRILTIVGIIILVAIAGGIIYLHQVKTRAIPDYNQDVFLEGMDENVEVFRDSLGIPHVYAKNEPDLYRAVGYLMAQDRLWQMDLLRRITTGRLSEVLDPGLVDADLLFRSLRFTEKSERVLSLTDPAILACIEAFSDGINQYIEKNTKKLPFEFTMLGYKPDPWEPVHTANLIGYMAWSLNSGWNNEIMLYKLSQVVDSVRFAELLPDLDLHEVAVFPETMVSEKDLELESPMKQAVEFIEDNGLQVFRGSNNWAVSGTRSKTGMPIMSNDMHLGLMAPGIWYQMHHVVEGKMDVTGVVLPGSPYVIAGHNADIAWGMTNVTVDDIDFYLETINPKDSNQYLLDGVWHNMELAEEEIRVKGKDEPLKITNRFTHRGPVVSRFKGVDDRVISCSWQGMAFSNELRTVHLLNRAGNWKDFRSAVSTFNSISQNIIYADRFGNIGLQTSAGVPIRNGSGILVYPGDTSLYDWQGIVPFEELPYALNPESGYVSSANNRTVGDDYPYYIGSWYSLPYRIGRIREMLDEKEEHGIEDFKRMLRDQKSHLAGLMMPFYLEALDETSDGVDSRVLEVLKNWDGVLSADSPAALIFEWMWIELQKAIVYDELGDEHLAKIMGNAISDNLINRIRQNGYSAWCDDIRTAGVTETFEDNIRASFERTVDTLTTMYGPDPESWKWGDLHKLTLEHPMGSVAIVEKLFKVNRGPYAVGGSFHTVCPYSYPSNRSFIANHGASERHIFNTADWDKSLTVIPTGTSGVPASPHYMDQTELYVNNLFHGDHFSRNAVEAGKMYRAVFRPEKAD